MDVICVKLMLKLLSRFELSDGDSFVAASFASSR